MIAGADWRIGGKRAFATADIRRNSWHVGLVVMRLGSFKMT